MSLRDQFISVFEPAMQEKGFERKSNGTTYHRLVNGKIIQMISYITLSHGYEFTVKFSILPLCLGGECSIYNDVDSLLSVFGVSSWESDDFYGFDKHIPTALKSTEKHLFPLLDSIVDYVSFLQKLPERSLLARELIIKTVQAEIRESPLVQFL